MPGSLAFALAAKSGGGGNLRSSWAKVSSAVVLLVSLAIASTPVFVWVPEYATRSPLLFLGRAPADGRCSGSAGSGATRSSSGPRNRDGGRSHRCSVPPETRRVAGVGPRQPSQRARRCPAGSRPTRQVAAAPSSPLLVRARDEGR